MVRFLYAGHVRARYIPEVLVCMRVGGASNRSVRNIVRKFIADDRLRHTPDIWKQIVHCFCLALRSPHREGVDRAPDDLRIGIEASLPETLTENDGVRAWTIFFGREAAP